jgi:hypothetical protein
MNFRFILISLVFFLLCDDLSYSQQLNKENIKQDLLKSLYANKEVTDEKQMNFHIVLFDFISNNLVIDSIPQNKIAVYRVSTGIKNVFFHILITYNDSFFFINMNRPISDIMIEVLYHFERSQFFTKEISIECIKNVLRTYESNKCYYQYDNK